MPPITPSRRAAGLYRLIPYSRYVEDRSQNKGAKRGSSKRSKNSKCSIKHKEIHPLATYDITNTSQTQSDIDRPLYPPFHTYYSLVVVDEGLKGFIGRSLGHYIGEIIVPFRTMLYSLEAIALHMIYLLYIELVIDLPLKALIPSGDIFKIRLLLL